MSDLLMNIRQNLINGNRDEARKQIKKYGISIFPNNYLDYLRMLEFDSDQIVIEEAEQAFKAMLYLFD